MSNENTAIGNFSMLGYVVVTALSGILIHHVNQTTSPLLSAFYTFLFCMFFYNVLSKASFNKRALIIQYHFEILMLNVTTAICWIFTFIALKYIPPELNLFMYLCAMPVTVSVVQRVHIYKSCVLLFGLVLLGSSYHGDHYIIGIVLAFLGGVSGAIYSLYSKRITSVFTGLEILSLRFFLTVVVTFIISMQVGDIKWMPVQDYRDFIFLSMISVIIPMTLFQLGIKYLQISKVMVFLPLAPLICYAANLFFGNITFSVMQIIAVSVLTIAMFF